MFETTFTLKQHTPMLHFLHDQPGATLRATELKPKLDRWIRDARNDHLPEEWIAKEDDKGHKALDYKITIKSNQVRDVLMPISEPRVDSRSETGKIYETRHYPQVLANVGGKPYEDELKNLVFSDEAIVSIFTFHEDLLSEIKANLPQLLVSHNFGNRGSKGFGSFTCIKIDNEPVTELPVLGYYFTWEVPSPYDFKNLFSAIDSFYKCIRSGINDVRPVERGNKDETRTIFYFKSLMYAYATKDDPTIDWDKKVIKEHFYEKLDLPEEKRQDFRDWLGLSTDETWRKNRQLTRRFSLSKKSLTDGIERFPSSILIKPIRFSNNQFRIYFGEQLSEETTRRFQNARIEVSMPSQRHVPLVLQPTNRFNIKEFLRFVYTYKDESRMLEHLDLYDDDNVNDPYHPLFRDTIAPIFRSLTLNPNAPRHA